MSTASTTVNYDVKTTDPAADAGYNPFLPYAGVTSERLRAEQGPRCANNACMKPKWVPPEAGGCACPRYSGGTDGGRVFRSIEHRNVEALEGILRVLTALAASMKVDVPPAPDEPALPERGVVGPADVARAGAKKTA